jgi:hypothetical protein
MPVICEGANDPPLRKTLVGLEEDRLLRLRETMKRAQDHPLE